MTSASTPSTDTDPALRIVPNHDESRYELWRDEQYIGFLGVEVLPDGTVDLQHTIISEAFGGRGYARTLVTRVLDGYRERGVRVRATCSYVQDYMDRFPAYRDLLADTPGPRGQG
ncbi:GNAT family N-acetyltransferase [Kocuria tytonicola]|uniref:N-acetyltransferase n=1 Tax=Kocuria tytonicola TaxID=2055946 RepID=A0A3L9LYR6_9MICC|nr:GNAT family N-acetyltransferase [Kocuria tytonicola]RLY94369.1 N-acetyltransferase [Kocuria tytonicola]RLZ03657.1 GNAT family N-acetyltransferase [Kocuria tytonicola]